MGSTTTGENLSSGGGVQDNATGVEGSGGGALFSGGDVSLEGDSVLNVIDDLLKSFEEEDRVASEVASIATIGDVTRGEKATDGPEASVAQRDSSVIVTPGTSSGTGSDGLGARVSMNESNVIVTPGTSSATASGDVNCDLNLVPEVSSI